MRYSPRLNRDVTLRSNDELAPPVALTIRRPTTNALSVSWRCARREIGRVRLGVIRAPLGTWQRSQRKTVPSFFPTWGRQRGPAAKGPDVKPDPFIASAAVLLIHGPVDTARHGARAALGEICARARRAVGDAAKRLAFRTAQWRRCANKSAHG